MTDNPLEANAKPKATKRSQAEWIERGNRILWGQEPTSKGDYLPQKLDLEWICRDGFYSIVPRR